MVILNFVDPALVLSFYAICCSVFCLGVALVTDRSGIGCLFALFFFESICYPVGGSFLASTRGLTMRYAVYFHTRDKEPRYLYKEGFGPHRYGTLYP